VGPDNNSVWAKGDYVSGYATQELRPPEVVFLLHYAELLSGRILEIGCGAGRITGYLGARGGGVLGLDISPAMIDYCRQHYSDITFEVGDVRELGRFADGSRDLIVAEFNILGVLDDLDRRRALRELNRILSPDGLLVFSAHNLAYLPRVAAPPRLVTRSRNPARAVWNLARLPRRMANHRHLKPLQRFESNYAIVNDEAHDFRLLHYYIGRDAQAEQLAETGFDLLECLDGSGRAVAAGSAADREPELHYAARRSASFPGQPLGLGQNLKQTPFGADISERP
jgi:SAM-dependent methyltransferase